MKILNWRMLLQLFYPARDTVSISEKILSGLAALSSILLVMFVSSFFLAAENLPYILASIGASAVLLFAIPFGPLSQPWSFVGGHLISGFIGVTVALMIPNLILAAATAVALAIVFMYVTRCLHPPGGATALIVIFGGEGIRELGYQFLLTPLLLNLVVMLAWALLLNNLIPNRYYPNTLKSLMQDEDKTPGADRPENTLGINREDLNFALKEMNEYVDVSDDDLKRIFNISAIHARQRQMGEIHCRDIMAQPVISADYSTEVETLWGLMRQHKIRGIPITDQKQQVIGIVTIADFLNQVKIDNDRPLKQGLAAFLKRTQDISTDKPEYAGHIMTSPAGTIREEQHIMDLFPIFHTQGIHHLPVVDEKGCLRGMITPKNLLAALYSDISSINPGKSS